MQKLLKFQLDSIRIQQNRVGYVNGPVVDSLLNHIDALDLELKIAKEDEEEAVRKHGEAELNIVRLIENCGQLAMKLKEVNEPKKALLPKEVAGAIGFLKSLGINNGEIIRLSLTTYRLSHCDHRRRLGEFSIDNPELIASALVNGYRIEEPKQPIDRDHHNRLAVKKLIEGWNGRQRELSVAVYEMMLQQAEIN